MFFAFNFLSEPHQKAVHGTVEKLDSNLFIKIVIDPSCKFYSRPTVVVGREQEDFTYQEYKAQVLEKVQVALHVVTLEILKLRR